MMPTVDLENLSAQRHARPSLIALRYDGPLQAQVTASVIEAYRERLTPAPPSTLEDD